MTGAGLDNDYDIVIAGGGMIGASLALALSPLCLRVAVVEACLVTCCKARWIMQHWLTCAVRRVS